MRTIQLASAVALSILVASAGTAQQAQQPPPGPSVPESMRTLDKGTDIKMKTQSQISSQSTRAGDTIQATINGNVKDITGSVVFPDGSPAVLEVVETPQGLAIAIRSVTALNQTYRVKPGTTSYSGRLDRDGKLDLTKRGNYGSPSDQTRNWDVFEKNERGMGTFSGLKQPAIGGDFVVPPGTEINFKFGDEAITIAS